MGEVTENWQRAEQAALFPLGPLPHIQRDSTATWFAPPGWTPKATPLYVTGTPRQKKVAQMKDQIKAPEKIQLNHKELANLSDAQCKILVIRMLTELVEFGCKLDEKMKAMLRETKENVQGTNSDGKESGTQIMVWTRRKKETSNQKKNEETRIQKSEERLRNLQDNFKHSNIWIMGVPEGEEQEMENLFEKIMRKNFPNMAKEIDFQEV